MGEKLTFFIRRFFFWIQRWCSRRHFAIVGDVLASSSPGIGEGKEEEVDFIFELCYSGGR